MALPLAALYEYDEQAFRALADQTPAMIWTADAGGVCNFFNARWLAFSGRKHDELVGQGWAELLHAHDRARHLGRYERALARRAVFRLDSRLRRADGAWRWLRCEVAPRYLAGGGPLAGFIGTAVDINEFRENEAALQGQLVQQALQEHALWLRLADLQESERRRLAIELHDRAGEPLTGLRLQLAAVMRGDLPADARQKLELCAGHVAGTMDAIAEVLGELRPPMLDEFGLAGALRWYGKQIQREAELQVTISVPQEPPRLPPQVEVALLRIAQESLRNVVRHARASHADVALSHDGRNATLRIEDDGVGFEAAAAQPARWGLLTIRERAFAIGARIDIASRAGEGTCVTVTLEEP